jgi:acyl-CoA synthetase (AMP-forming)/AMP-acid ligase II
LICFFTQNFYRKKMLYQDVLVKTSEKYPDLTAVIFNDTSTSYMQLKQHVDVVAENLWRFGVRPGDYLSTYLSNCLENLVFNLAIFKLGAVSVPIRAQLQAADISHIVSEAQPKIIITSSMLAPELKKALGAKINDGSTQCFVMAPEYLVPEWCLNFSALQAPHDEQVLPAVDVPSDAEVTVLYTSGSTGKPKGAVHTHEQWLFNAGLNAGNFNHGDITYVALSINHCHGLGEQVLPALLNGATLILSDGFKRDDFMRAVTSGLQINGVTFKASSFYGVPSMFNSLAELSQEQLATMPPHHLRLLDFAGDVLPPVIQNKIRALFGIALSVTYGMTETMCIARGPTSNEDVTAVIGKIRPGVSIKIDDPDETGAGELQICGPLVCKRYLNSGEKEKNTVDGYFGTGDIVRGDPFELKYVNRLKRMIVASGGYKLNPSDIEAVLTEHSRVKQSCVFDIHDATGKLLIIALVVLASDAQDVSASILFALFERIATQHRPHVVSIVDELKLGNTGKVNWRFYQTAACEALAAPQEDSYTYYDSRNSP